MSASPRADLVQKPPSTRWSQVFQHWKLAAAGALVLAIVAVYPLIGGALASRLLAKQVEARLGLRFEAARTRARLGSVVFERVSLVPPGETDPDVRITIDKLVLPYAAAWGGGQVQLEAPALEARSVAAVRRLERSAAPQAETGAAATTRRRYPKVAFTRGRVHVGRQPQGAFTAEDVQGEVLPDDHVRVSLTNVEGDAASWVGAENAGAFGARAVRFRVALEGLRPEGLPSFEVDDGYLQVLPNLGLTGITGKVSRKSGAERQLTLGFHGSYGGSRERLWNAVGGVRLGHAWQDSEGTLALRAERFTLDKIRDVLPPTVSKPEATSVAGTLNMRLAAGVLAVNGTLGIENLGVHHAALSSEPVEGLSASIDLEGSYDARARTVTLSRLEGRLKDLTARLAARLELAEGTYTFEDGRTWPFLPKIEVTLEVPSLPCQKVLSSFPAAIVPRLTGFSLKGNFEAHLATKIDYADLEGLTLDGKVGIDGCRVMAAPAEVLDLTDDDMPITQVVQVPPNWDEKGTESQELVFVVGPDSADFVPLNEVSPHLINAFLTTEDGSFFKHRGFATREFRTALKRNLERGRFRQGASSITMQMVKNLLLSHEKTLSRKLQELFLVWYLEQVLTKERILELYLNAIEFGPRIYGIGPAARHYFGKLASELNPVEAAFFSSILPSPKRRYVSYCHGALSSSAERHVRRILARMHERERLTDEELALAMQTPLVFDTTERGANERQCLEWIARITATPRSEPELPEDAE